MMPNLRVEAGQAEPDPLAGAAEAAAAKRDRMAVVSCMVDSSMRMLKTMRNSMNFNRLQPRRFIQATLTSMLHDVDCPKICVLPKTGYEKCQGGGPLSLVFAVAAFARDYSASLAQGG